MTIFVYKGLTRNPEFINTPPGFFPMSGECGELRIPQIVFDKKSPNAVKRQRYSLGRFISSSCKENTRRIIIRK